MSKVVKYVAGTLIFGLFTEIVYQIYVRLNSKKEDKKCITEVLFFPDLKVACKAHFTSIEGCNNRHCRYTHSGNSLSRLYNYLTLSRKSLDVCVFVLSCADLADILILVHKRGVMVRIITDNEQVNVQGSQIWRLRSEGKFSCLFSGIIVRTDNSSFFMHHKFVVIDNEILINGSFNWTRQAITGNQENLVVMNDPEIVQQFQTEFENMWTEFDPRVTYMKTTEDT
ncbi:hypothetical protein KUTeg_003552 [Tegillarca granosa]|uniref:Mitochondrial cardiolipin hydrolase n=1 Tax=Tegillarca granosa TaxID=220873 RepID=A0ABQ9FQM9_TEGGR|nr:hypothetical protein KUTeg_003552 [Tegillarca granosa]